MSTGFVMVMKKAKQPAESDSMDGYVTQAEAARKKGVTLHVLNSWVHRNRVRSKEVYGRRLAYLPDVMAYDSAANKGGRPPKPTSTTKRATGQKNASNGPSSKKKGR
jgi:hypothetical protein